MDKTGQTFKSAANKTGQSKMMASDKNTTKMSDKNVTKTSEMAKASSKKDEIDTKRSE